MTAGAADRRVAHGAAHRGRARRARGARPAQRRARQLVPRAADGEPARAPRRRDARGRAAAHRGSGRDRRGRPDASRRAPCLRSYFAELDRRSDTAFDPTTGSTAEPHELRPPAGVFLVAYLRGEPIGCGAPQAPPRRARPTSSACGSPSRPAGWGSAGGCWRSSRRGPPSTGTASVRLETNAALTEAIALYRSAGYVEVPAFNDEPFAHHWFEKILR